MGLVALIVMSGDDPFKSGSVQLCRRVRVSGRTAAASPQQSSPPRCSTRATSRSKHRGSRPPSRWVPDETLPGIAAPIVDESRAVAQRGGGRIDRRRSSSQSRAPALPSAARRDRARRLRQWLPRQASERFGLTPRFALFLALLVSVAEDRGARSPRRSRVERSRSPSPFARPGVPVDRSERRPASWGLRR